jgi:hypothetical protein
MATPPHPIWFCCNCVQLLGFLLQFWCNSGAILLQLCCNCSAICTCDWAGLATGLGRPQIRNAYRYWPGAEWECDRAPPMTNQAGKNTRRKDAWRKLAQWPVRSDLVVSRFPIFQHRLSHALNIPFLKGSVKGFLWRHGHCPIKAHHRIVVGYFFVNHSRAPLSSALMMR